MAEVASLGQKQWETICSETCPGDEYCMVVIMNAMMLIILVKTCSLCTTVQSEAISFMMKRDF